MEDFEFLVGNPIGALMKKGARRAGSAVKKGFTGQLGKIRNISTGGIGRLSGRTGMKIPGKMLDPTKSSTRAARAGFAKGNAARNLRKNAPGRVKHNSAIREAFAPNPLISNRYNTMGNYYIGQGAGDLAKKKIGASNKIAGTTKAQQVTKRVRGLGQVGTSRRALTAAGGLGSSGQRIVQGAIQNYSAIEKLIHLDARLDGAIELSKKPVRTIKNLSQKQIRKMHLAELLRKIR